MQSHCLRNKKDSTQRHIKGHKPSTWGEHTKKMPKQRNKNKVKIQVRLTNAQGIAPKVLYLSFIHNNLHSKTLFNQEKKTPSLTLLCTSAYKEVTLEACY